MTPVWLPTHAYPFHKLIFNFELQVSIFKALTVRQQSHLGSLGLVTLRFEPLTP